MANADPAWYTDVRVLPRRAADFFPAKGQSPEERLNTIVRLVAYVAIAIAAYRRATWPLFSGVGVIAALSAVHAFGVERFSGPNRGAPVRASRARGQCTRSTRANPFGNVLLTEYANADRAPACDYDDMHDDISKHFNEGLYRNITDVYDRENSQRQFMTNPVTTNIPDTVAFAQFAYGSEARGCKESPSQCTGFEQ
jgi:hypothetical protein